MTQRTIGSHGWKKARATFGGVSAAVVLAFSAHITDARAQATYWIDESTDFTGNGCQNSDLNDVTSSLRSRLNADGWTGTRWTNANAWPEDFIEQGLGGIDHVAGDNALLSVYAGHGNRALLQFGFRRNNRCTVTLDSATAGARLGRLGGDRAGYAIYVTSCTINTGSISRHFGQHLRQSFGYHNSPPVKDDQPRDFFEATSSLRNSRAWIEEMEDRPGWFTGDNSPITLTFGTSATHCAFVQDNARLRGNVLRSTSPTPITNFCFVMFDHGASGC